MLCTGLSDSQSDQRNGRYQVQPTVSHKLDFPTALTKGIKCLVNYLLKFNRLAMVRKLDGRAFKRYYNFPIITCLYIFLSTLLNLY